MNSIRMLGALDPVFGWTGTELITTCAEELLPESHLRGAYACMSVERGVARLVRDPLGLGKLFWAVDPDGTLLFSARPWRLVEAGCAFRDIRAVPPGTIIELDLERDDERMESLPPPQRSPREPVTPRSVEAIAADIRATLDGYCAALAVWYPNARVFVCLS